MSWVRKRRSALADEFFGSYLCWRKACVDVRTAYWRWENCISQQRGLEFSIYLAALELEEYAASIHSDSAERLGALETLVAASLDVSRGEVARAAEQLASQTAER
jgi:hypothetical protein